MREIEIKVTIDDVQDALAKIVAAGVVVSEPKEQHDVVYCLPEDKDKENDPSVNWLRIRMQDRSITYFTLKRSVAGSLDSIEHETVVEKAEELEAMLHYMGYIVYSDLVKVRRTAHLPGDIEVCVDEVPPLGAFIELEKLCANDADGATVEHELLTALNNLGIAYGERITRGYDELMNDYLAKGKDE